MKTDSEIDAFYDAYYKILSESHTALFKNKEYDLAIEILDKAIKSSEESEEFSPLIADYYVNLSWAYHEKNDLDSALAAITKAVELRGFDWDYQKRGQVYEDMGNYDDAITDYTKAIENGEDPNSYDLRAKVYFNKKDYDSAMADFTKAIENCSNVSECKGCIKAREFISKIDKLREYDNGN